MKRKMFLLFSGMLLWGVAFTQASPGSFRILIESGSPYYSPQTISVQPGIPIHWENPTATYHTVTHDGCLDGSGCAFDSGAILPDKMFEVINLQPGIYPYHCTLHPIMRGHLVITTDNKQQRQPQEL
ncbi:MAG: hypothetical protein GKS05_11135 [Nitrospirales bacterium]|nr:hypothetical protein [Nitrospirales bacterium]